MLILSGEGASVFAINDPQRELIGIGLYMLLPMLAVSSFSYLALCRWSGRGESGGAVFASLPRRRWSGCYHM